MGKCLSKTFHIRDRNFVKQEKYFQQPLIAHDKSTKKTRYFYVHIENGHKLSELLSVFSL